VFPATGKRRAALPQVTAAVRMTSYQQGVLSVRLSLVYATFVAGPLSILVLAAPATAQQPVPGGARPPVGPSAAAPAVAGTSVAVIDIAYIFKNHVRFNAQMNDMKRDIEAFDASIRADQQNFAQKREKLTSFNPSSPEYKKAEEELAHIKSDLDIKVAVKRREFLEQEAKVYYGIYREIEDSVAMFAQRNRIGLVLRYSGDEMKPEDRASVLQGVNKPVVYQDRLDITQHILNQLNAGATMPAGAGGVAPPGSSGSQIVPGTQNAMPPNRPILPQGTQGRPVPGPR
jgi:Skp family chaperone for outer membrane proteins